MSTGNQLIPLNELGAEAAKFHRFNGQFDPWASADAGNAVQMYTGEYDHFLSFGGDTGGHPLNLTVPSQMQTRNAFTVTITNANNVDVEVMLYGGALPDSVNLAQTGATLAKGGQAITVATSPKTLKHLQQLIDLEPINFLGCKLDADTVTAKNAGFTFRYWESFKINDRVEDVQFSDYITGDQLNQQTIHVNVEREISKRVQWDVLVPKNTILNVRCFFGASLSLHQALKNKNAAAKQTMARIGG